MEPDFAIHLGGNLYLDSSGMITNNVLPSTLIYRPSDRFRFDPEKVAAALEKFAKLLPDSGEERKELKELGVSIGLANELFNLGKFASVVAGAATVFAIFVIVAGLVKLFQDAD